MLCLLKKIAISTISCNFPFGLTLKVIGSPYCLLSNANVNSPILPSQTKNECDDCFGLRQLFREVQDPFFNGYRLNILFDGKIPLRGAEFLDGFHLDRLFSLAEEPTPKNKIKKEESIDLPLLLCVMLCILFIALLSTVVDLLSEVLSAGYHLGRSVLGYLQHCAARLPLLVHPSNYPPDYFENELFLDILFEDSIKQSDMSAC